MQTFVPEETYARSAAMLDRARLGKQRVEVLQMASALLNPAYGWSNHPAVNMWRGHGSALLTYGLVVCDEWTNRGYKDSCRPKLVRMLPLMASLGERITRPPWWGGEIHDSHKARLYIKNSGYYEHYEPVFDSQGPEYFWPTGTPRSITHKEAIVKTRSQLVCRGCGRRPGFTNIGNREFHWWVCGNCGRPTEGWFSGTEKDVLNMFRGGPLADRIYDSRTLLTDDRLSSIVLGYQYSQERITSSSSTGSVARVWIYSKPDTVTQSAQHGNPSSNQGAPTIMSETPEVPAVPTDETTVAPTETAAPAAEKVAVDVSDLEPKRKSLGLSRSKVAEAAGVTQAVLYRVEKGGSRTTQDEADRVRNALRELEAAQPAAPAEGEAATAGNPE